MQVEILPVGSDRDSRAVIANGHHVGFIRKVSPRRPWVDLTGTRRIGTRWIPDGVPEDVEGPSTGPEAAAAVLLAAGYNPRTVLDALPLTRYRRVDAL